MANPRSTKLRTSTISGAEPDEVPSRARAYKPPAKAISARKAAARSSRGGGKLPPKVRKELERDPTPVRSRAVGRKNGPPAETRYGKRKPRAGGR